MTRWADDHVLLEALGYLAGIPPGRCYYLSTVVIRLAVEEWVEALRKHPTLHRDVERVLNDRAYRYDLYQAARESNPQKRRDAERYRAQQRIEREEAERRSSAAQADAAVEAATLAQAIKDGKAVQFNARRKPKVEA